MHPYRAITGTTTATALVVLPHLLGLADPPGINAITDGRFVR